MTDAPMILRPDGTALWKQGAAEFSVYGLSCIFGALSAAVDRMPFDPHGLLHFLHVRLYYRDEAKARSRHMIGRFWNKLTGANAEYVELSGVQLSQVLEMAGAPRPEGVTIAGRYLLHHEVARAAYKALRKELG